MINISTESQQVASSEERVHDSVDISASGSNKTPEVGPNEASLMGL